MILVDTSLWIDHLRSGRPDLAERLDAAEEACHPFVVGEPACAGLVRCAEILGMLQELPAAAVAEQDEVLGFAARERLHGRGLGWVDVHLLAAARRGGCRLWTRDTALEAAAHDLGIGFPADSQRVL